MRRFFRNGCALALAFIVGGGSVFAALPNTIWKPLNAYTAAKEKNDTASIIKHAEEMVAIMEKQPDSQDKTDLLGARYDELARLYEAQKNYPKAKAYYEKYLPYGIKKGWTDGVNYAKKKINLLDTKLEVYQETSEVTAPYYNAKFEPKKGVYYGSVYDKDPDVGVGYYHEDIREKYPEEESLLLAYLEFGHDISRLQNYFELAKQQNKAIVLAWNTYASNFGEMAKHTNIQNVEAYIDETLHYIESQGVPVFLRFANEMNVGPNGKNKDEYITSFRHIAKKAKTKKNIAMVWAPNDVGATDRPFADYYPGNEYVDWIGLSMYPLQYFGGKEDTNPRSKDNNDTAFLAGPNANPLLRVQPVIEFMKENNIQKPIMITECGMHHKVNTLGKDTTAWANYQLQKTYSEMIRMYPQIKGICYFNTVIDKGPNDYALFTNATLLNTYNQYVQEEIFIKEMGKDSAISYGKIKNETVLNKNKGPITLSAAAYYPFITEPGRMSVEYRVAGKWIASPSTPPYKVTLTQDQLALGDELTVKLLVDGKVMNTQNIKLK